MPKQEPPLNFPCLPFSTWPPGPSLAYDILLGRRTGMFRGFMWLPVFLDVAQAQSAFLLN